MTDQPGGEKEGRWKFKGKTFKSLIRIASEFPVDPDGFDHVKPLLRFGSFFWIPDLSVEFPRPEVECEKVGYHPYVLKDNYLPHKPFIRTLLRTSQVGKYEGLLMPGGTLPGLTREGVIRVAHSYKRKPMEFVPPMAEHIGTLSDEWKQKLEDAIKSSCGCTVTTTKRRH